MRVETYNRGEIVVYEIYTANICLRIELYDGKPIAMMLTQEPTMLFWAEITNEVNEQA